MVQHENMTFGGASHGDNQNLWMKATEFEDYLDYFIALNEIQVIV